LLVLGCRVQVVGCREQVVGCTIFERGMNIGVKNKKIRQRVRF